MSLDYCGSPCDCVSVACDAGGCRVRLNLYGDEAYAQKSAEEAEWSTKRDEDYPEMLSLAEHFCPEHTPTEPAS